MDCFSILIEVDVTVKSKEEAEEIAHDFHEILNYNGFINSVNVTDEISY